MGFAKEQRRKLLFPLNIAYTLGILKCKNVKIRQDRSLKYKRKNKLAVHVAVMVYAENPCYLTSKLFHLQCCSQSDILKAPSFRDTSITGGVSNVIFGSTEPLRYLVKCLTAGFYFLLLV